MIVADTSYWIDHWKVANLAFARQLADGDVLMHPFVLGELALGSLRNRLDTISDLRAMLTLPPASHEEVMVLIEARRLYSRGIGYVDSHLLAAALLAGSVKLLTGDRRLHAAAEQLGIAA
ncbi:PIN domain-containing protein [Devosia sp. XJ19-1]|uniref:PIN domain-containing protein n=1 Tax=Devosia ureilytica TaxID=2952754 RepID=A0A9Q4AKZ3_9HYPH|nr:PIN domain-containing protein [Devosia ureilytica]MCP8882587.1 PIN domain-containing protein [Devosia ureilytica]MCP8885526.1 PIN domain-containing protein [Devosia ureilytica]